MPSWPRGWLTLTDLDAIVLPRKTLARRRKLGVLIGHGIVV